MAIPKDIRFVTFDCYGTLIDWERGAFAAFEAEAARDEVTLDRDKFVEDFLRIQYEIEEGSYELYAEVLRRTAVRCAKEQGWRLESARSRFFPHSIESWLPFKETNRVLQRVGKKFDFGLVSNIDDKLLGITRRHLEADFDLVVTAQQVRSYKPDPAHFKECGRRIGGKKGWVHIAAGYDTDVAPCLKLRIPVIWVNRKGEKLEQGKKKPDATVKDLRGAAKLLKV